jgi:hypothetical protein
MEMKMRMSVVVDSEKCNLVGTMSNFQSAVPSDHVVQLVSCKPLIGMRLITLAKDQ